MTTAHWATLARNRYTLLPHPLASRLDDIVSLDFARTTGMAVLIVRYLRHNGHISLSGPCRECGQHLEVETYKPKPRQIWMPFGEGFVIGTLICWHIFSTRSVWI